jgi:hypothetical protein
MRSTGAQLADVVVPALALLTIGGAITYFVWRVVREKGQDSGGHLASPPPPPRFKSQVFTPPRLRKRKKDQPRFYRSPEAFTRDVSEGYDLEVED